MPSPARLRGSLRFSQLYREGRTWGNSRLALKGLPNEMENSRFAFAVGKALGQAVRRNRLRRRLREIVRLTPTRGGWDIMLIARPPAMEADFNQIREAVIDLLRRSGLLKEG